MTGQINEYGFSMIKSRSTSESLREDRDSIAVALVCRMSRKALTVIGAQLAVDLVIRHSQCRDVAQKLDMQR